MNLLRMIFIWWRDATPGTWLTTWLYGRKVGEDKFGNRYFQNKSGSRRWVIYNGTVEASRVPPDWHGWLHHTFKEPPTEAGLQGQDLGKGASAQYVGHRWAPIIPKEVWPRGGCRAPATGDYEAWKP